MLLCRSIASDQDCLWLRRCADLQGCRNILFTFCWTFHNALLTFVLSRALYRFSMPAFYVENCRRPLHVTFCIEMLGLPLSLCKFLLQIIGIDNEADGMLTRQCPAVMATATSACGLVFAGPDCVDPMKKRPKPQVLLTCIRPLRRLL